MFLYHFTEFHFASLASVGQRSYSKLNFMLVWLIHFSDILIYFASLIFAHFSVVFCLWFRLHPKECSVLLPFLRSVLPFVTFQFQLWLWLFYAPWVWIWVIFFAFIILLTFTRDIINGDISQIQGCILYMKVARECCRNNKNKKSWIVKRILWMLMTLLKTIHQFFALFNLFITYQKVIPTTIPRLLDSKTFWILCI